jgi:hypothetical protein
VLSFERETRILLLEFAYGAAIKADQGHRARIFSVLSHQYWTRDLVYTHKPVSYLDQEQFASSIRP